MNSPRQTLKRSAPATAALAGAAIVSIICAAGPATQPSASVVLPPTVKSPAATGKSNLVAMPYKPVLPPAVVSSEPRPLPGDSLKKLRAGPAIDLPPLAESASPAPGAVQLASAPPVAVASANPADLPVGAIAAHPDIGRPTLQTDPTEGLAVAGALLVNAPPRTESPAAEFLSIPDPAHQSGALPTPVARFEDPPVSTIDRPGPTTLPTGK